MEESQQLAQLGVMGRTILAGAGVGLEGSGGQHQDTRVLVAVLVVEELLSELSSLRDVRSDLKQLGEALELVEDHKVRLERGDADPCEFFAELSDQRQSRFVVVALELSIPRDVGQA